MGGSRVDVVPSVVDDVVVVVEVLVIVDVDVDVVVVDVVVVILGVVVAPHRQPSQSH